MYILIKIFKKNINKKIYIKKKNKKKINKKNK